ncbi:GGDEF domain-containing protein [Shewanella khirikhana]|uniref:GGDEF domain-containing protein n=1 Tax=Shewanella khirikhana TaxID=1965282 RepID=UPI0030CC0009
MTMRPLQSLKRKLTMVFYLIFLMTVGIGFIAVSLSQSLKQQVDAMVAGDLEEVRLAMTQIRQAEQLQTTIARLQNVTEESQRHTLLGDLQAQWLLLQKGTRELIEHHPDDALRTGLNQEAMAQEVMLAKLPRLDALTKEVLQARAQMANITHNLASVQSGFTREYRAILDQQDSSAKAALDQRALPRLSQALDIHRQSAEFLYLGERLFSTLQRTTEHLSSNEINTLQRQGLRQLLEMESLALTLTDKDKAANWLSQLRHEMVGSDNLFELARNLQRRYSVAYTHLEEHALRARASADFFQGEFRRKDANIQAAGVELKRDAVAFLVLIVMAGILYCGFIWLTNWHFIAKGIIKPVIATRNAMNDIVNEKLDTELPKADNLELQQMMSSLETLKSYAAQVKAISEIDGLTGIHNRRYFDLQLAAAMATHPLGHSNLGLLLFDLDFFKQYNDCYGHLAGDACLKDVVKQVRKLLPGRGETFARYGGEEFVLLLPGSDWGNLVDMAENIRAGVEALAIPHSHSMQGIVTLSIGGALLPADVHSSAAELVAMGDKALYRAKNRGKNCSEILVMAPNALPEAMDSPAC